MAKPPTTTWHLTWEPDAGFYDNHLPPKRVFVASTLNNWKYEDPKCEMKLTKEYEYNGYDKPITIFKIDIPNAPIGVRILYKFIVDGQWYHDPTFPIETDSENNINNVIILD